LTLTETARRVGCYAWVEGRVFEIMGGWVATVPELDVKLRFGTDCYHHAWHAELWRSRLPQLDQVDRDDLTAPANDELEAFMAALAAPDGAHETIEKLIGIYRVLLPHKVAAYTHHLRAASSVTDGPVIRALNLVLADELDDWRRGELLIQAQLTSPDAVGRAAEHQGRLEALVVNAGGIAGPGPLRWGSSERGGD
jgi:hypothetical protein